MSFSYVNEPVVDMRELASYESKIVSQALFAEPVIVQEGVEGWLRIETPDGYSGWVVSTSVINLREPYLTTMQTSRLKAHIYHLKDTEYGPIKSLPFGSKLQVLDETDHRWLKIALPDGRECFIQKGDVMTLEMSLTKPLLPSLSEQFLNLPYTWGGRSSFGYDCSGFVQMLYSRIGITLPRDANQQILDNRFKVVNLDELEPGDLIFFGRSEQKINHVGMSIGRGQFVHATVAENQPWIRISHLTDEAWRGEGSNHPYRAAHRFIPGVIQEPEFCKVGASQFN